MKHKVVQIGFDILTKKDIPVAELESLFSAIEDTINNFYDINGNAVKFESLGNFNYIDISKPYEYYLKNVVEKLPD